MRPFGHLNYPHIAIITLPSRYFITFDAVTRVKPNANANVSEFERLIKWHRVLVLLLDIQ